MSNWLKRFLEIKDEPLVKVTLPIPKGNKMADKTFDNPESEGFQKLAAESARNAQPVPARDPAASIATPYGLVQRTAPRTLGSLTLDEAEAFMLHVLEQLGQTAQAKPQLTAEEQAKRIQAAIAAALAQ